MNARFTGNTMTLSHFHDFYYLEALMAGLSMAISNNPELAYHRSVEKLEADVKEAFAELAHQMAFRIYVYLWAASLGEARYAKGFELKKYFPQLHGQSRSNVYALALDCFPSDENVKNLKAIFNQSWGGSYGGRAWLNIVEAMEMYGKVSDATFVDHSVDLEHNGGNVFSKGAKFGLDCFSGTMNKSFLDHKFSHNILESLPRYYDKVDVTLKTKRLVERYMNIVTKVGSASYIKMLLVLDKMNVKNEWLKDYSVEWGNTELEFVDKTVKKQEATKAEKVVKTGAHIARVHEETHKYYVKWNGRSEGVGWCGNMHRYDGRIVTMTYKSNRQAYALGYIWSYKWLYEVEEELRDGYYEVLSVTDNAEGSYGGHWCGDMMDKYIGQTLYLKVHKMASNGKVYLKNDNIMWYFAPEWVKPVSAVVEEERRERRERRPHERCADCGCRIDEWNGVYSGITYESYCESCYNDKFTHCDKCGNDVLQSDTVQTDHHPKYYSLCESCADDVMTKCWECDELYPNNETVESDEGYHYCEYCARKYTCDKCGGVYENVEEHKNTRHNKRGENE